VVLQGDEMSLIHLQSIHQHPVKSCTPITISRGWIDSLGLAGDRRYMLIDADGKFMTARKYPKLTTLQATSINQGLVLAAPNQPSLVLLEETYSEEYRTTAVWKQTLEGQICGAQANDWLSHFLGTPCQLLFFGKKSTRIIEGYDTQQVSFADGYPLLLTNTSSLDWLQEHCPSSIDMEQFRPNLVVTGATAFAEDNWREIRIGDVHFTVHSPCTRCKLTTLPPRSETFDAQQEPLRTMLKYRRGHDGGALFGQNLIPMNTGIIEAGSELEIIKEAPANIIRATD